MSDITDHTEMLPAAVATQDSLPELPVPSSPRAPEDRETVPDRLYPTRSGKRLQTKGFLQWCSAASR